MTYRRATVADAVFIADLLQRFYARSGAVFGVPAHYASILATALEVIENGICLVGTTSCAGALICPFPWNRDAKIAQVVFWYFRRAREIGIYDALLEACRKAGATHINAASLFPGNALGRFYGKRKHAPAEIQYLAALN